MAEPMTTYRGVVLPDWVDDNDHMNDGYYPVAFGIATWDLQDRLGLDKPYRERTRCTLYTVEAHVTYARELVQGQALHVESLVVGVDAKRVHAFHRMFATEAGYLAGTMEVMMLHYDQDNEKVLELPGDLLASIREIETGHAELGRPAELGRSVRGVRRQ